MLIGNPCLSFCLGPGHINNVYNTCFWALVHNGMSNTDAVKRLKVCVYH